MSVSAFDTRMVKPAASEAAVVPSVRAPKPEIPQPAPQKLLRHVVLFKFKETASAANIKVVEDAFLLLPSKIKTIKSFEWGINNSPEKINEGLTHCFLADCHLYFSLLI